MDAELCPYDERLRPFDPPMSQAEQTALFATAKKFFDSWRERVKRHF